jgi:ABC-2 type transport system ATP-binding protein
MATTSSIPSSSSSFPPLAEGATWAIKADNLVKRFGSFTAVNGISFTVPQRSVFSILGPNGAGKTTLLRMLTTITRPTEGTAWIEGFNTHTQLYDVRQRIGVVAQDNHFDRYLSIWHNLILHAQMHGLNRSDYEARITDLLKRVDLFDRRNESPDVLSGGMKRRVSLIRALIHEPAVLFLDEPTTGLDPQARRDLWDTIGQFKQRATIILTTHYLEEADVLSDYVMMVRNGQVVASGTPTALKQATGQTETIELVFKIPEQAEVARHALTLALPMVTITTPNGNSTERVELTGHVQLPQVLALVNTDNLLRAGWVEPDLETVFFHIADRKE